MTNLIEASRLNIGYDKPLAKNLNFSLQEGKILQISGLNGSGKTTLLKTILGEIKSLKGTIVTNGRFTYLPQITKDYQHFSLTLGEIIGCSAINPKVLELFSADLLNTRWKDASGGQRQKTLMASRVSLNPQILVLDEPFNHLDKEAVSEVESMLLYLLEQKYIRGLIIVSHLSIEGMGEDITKVEL